MSGVRIRPEITASQRRALRWLHNRGGEGVFNRNQVLLAQGELAGVMRKTWSVLAEADPPCVTLSAGKGCKRVVLTEAGKVVALTWAGDEADTVEDGDDA